MVYEFRERIERGLAITGYIMLKKRGHEKEPFMSWHRLSETNSMRNTTFFNAVNDAGMPSLLVDQRHLLAHAIRTVMEFEYRNRAVLPFNSVHINDIETKFTEKYLNFTQTDFVYSFDNNILIDRVDSIRSNRNAVTWLDHGVKEIQVMHCSTIRDGDEQLVAHDRYLQDAIDYIRYYCERKSTASNFREIFNP